MPNFKSDKYDNQQHPPALGSLAEPLPYRYFLLSDWIAITASGGTLFLHILLTALNIQAQLSPYSK